MEPTSTHDLAAAPSPSEGAVRRIRTLVIVGLAGAIGMLVASAVASVQWGPPGTTGYALYEAANRVAALMILPTVAAPVALAAVLAALGRRGSTAMSAAAAALVVASVGVVVEFTVFTAAPYQGPGSEGRLAAYLLFFVAALVFLVATGRVGWLQRGRPPAWAAVNLLLWPVLGITAALVGGSLFYGVGVSAIVIGLTARALLDLDDADATSDDSDEIEDLEPAATDDDTRA